MITVTDSLTIGAPVKRVYEYCWNAELWPSITPHVRQVEFLESTAERQLMRMVVESGGKLYTTESERNTVPGEYITYRQRTPPVFLHEHSGEWRFTSAQGKTRVELTHRFEADHAAARQALGLAESDDVDSAIAERLKRNGLLTLSAVKEAAERESN
jgi:uncharacterized membrane protein